MDNDAYIFYILCDMVGDRVYPDIAPQDKLPDYPFIVYRMIGIDARNTNCGTIGTHCNYQIDVYSLSAKYRNMLGRQVLNRLSENGVSIDAYRHDFMNELRTYRGSIDVSLLNKE